jgi:nitrate reductase gamma subunit
MGYLLEFFKYGIYVCLIQHPKGLISPLRLRAWLQNNKQSWKCLVAVCVVSPNTLMLKRRWKFSSVTD